MILLSVCPVLFGSDEWTEITIEGDDEAAVAAIIASRLGSLDWEVNQEDYEDESPA